MISNMDDLSIFAMLRGLIDGLSFALIYGSLILFTSALVNRFVWKKEAWIRGFFLAASITLVARAVETLLGFMILPLLSNSQGLDIFQLMEMMVAYHLYNWGFLSFSDHMEFYLNVTLSWLSLVSLVSTMVLCRQKKVNHLPGEATTGVSFPPEMGGSLGESVFQGTVLDYFLRRLGWSAFALVTLGLGLPWVICWYQKWESENTIIDGRRLEFSGKGQDLLGPYLLWILLSIVTLGLYLIWVPVVLKRWITARTHLVEPSKVS